MPSQPAIAGVLPEENLIHLRGNDIAGFLQGQLTCDLQPLSPRHSVGGALCNPKGRVLTDLQVLEAGDGHCLLRLRRELADGIAERLRLYARFSRIEVEVDDGGLCVAAACGDAREELLAALGLPTPTAPGEVTAAGGALCRRAASGSCELILPAALAREQAPLRRPQAASTAWSREQLAAGLYRIEAADSGQYTPQALNYDLAGLVSFTKGCYTGQEVVARLHYRGQSKRRLALLEAAPGAAVPAPGTALHYDAGAAAGTLLRALTTPGGGWLCAAMLPGDAVAGSELHPADGACTLRILPLPYADAR